MTPHAIPKIVALVDDIEHTRRQPRPARDIGAFMLDHAVRHLGEAYRARGLTPDTLPEPGLTHDARYVFAGRVVVTTRSEWYVFDADALGVGIVGLDLIPEALDPARAGELVARITHTLADLDLWTRRGGWLALLLPGGGVRVVDLPR